MTFVGAVRTCLRQYATFSGRARRSEYWWFWLFSQVVNILLSAAEELAGMKASPFSGLWGLAMLLPTLAAGSRRLHDTGRSGWWQLLVLVPIVGWIALIVLLCGDSQAENQYGASPKAVRQP